MEQQNILSFKDLIKLFGSLNFKVTTIDELWDQLLRRFHETKLLEQMKVGRLDINIMIEASVFDLDERDDYYNYDSGLPINAAGVVHQSYPTLNNGRGVVDAYPLADCTFSEEDMSLLMAFGNIIYLLMSRIRLGINVEKSRYMDLMTGLYNTAGVRMEGKKLEAVGELFCMAVIFINLRGFSYTNKRIGIKNGDQVLIRYARLLNTLVGMNRGLAARLGGDKFLLIIPKSQLDTALSILEDVQIDIQIFDHTEHVAVNAWIGVFENSETDSIDEALESASVACGVAHATGTYHAVRFQPTMLEHSIRAKRLVASFDVAIKNHDFYPCYQPKVALDTGKLVAAEALVRWENHGEVLLPDDFIPALSDNGKMIELDLYMLECVCRDLRRWLDVGLPAVPVSINYSKENLIRRQLVDETLGMLKKYNLDPSLIEIELTELANYEDPRALEEFITQMHANGIRVSMDDFGTGYTSLNLLKDMSFDVVKMDRSVISRIGDKNESRDEILLRHTLMMLAELGTDIVVEGVETREQLEFIRGINDKLAIQGFFCDEPLSCDEFEARLTDKSYSL
ncbi:MAG: EAL domain-containing protein [Lachnospiraceae bacterium]|nr:EAL domain-containing protein [Lachnospiraceae bacterium]